MRPTGPGFRLCSDDVAHVWARALRYLDPVERSEDPCSTRSSR